MRAAFDTSVLVAALVAPHPSHARALPWLEACGGAVTGECSWHALAETWSVLTRLPIDPPIPPALASAAIERVAARLVVRSAGGDEYRAAMRRCSERSVRSGALFDALHLACAEASGADVLLTFNASDFERLSQEGPPRIVVPPDPPGIRLPG